MLGRGSAANDEFRMTKDEGRKEQGEKLHEVRCWIDSSFCIRISSLPLLRPLLHEGDVLRDFGIVSAEILHHVAVIHGFGFGAFVLGVGHPLIKLGAVGFELAFEFGIRGKIGELEGVAMVVVEFFRCACGAEEQRFGDCG